MIENSENTAKNQIIADAGDFFDDLDIDLSQATDTDGEPEGDAGVIAGDVFAAANVSVDGDFDSLVDRAAESWAASPATQDESSVLKEINQPNGNQQQKFRPRRKDSIKLIDASGKLIGGGHGLAIPLYLDLECIPDESRMHLYNLPTVDPLPEEAAIESLPYISEVLAMSINQIEATLLKLNPPTGWLNELADAESAAKKPRTGVQKAIEKLIERRAEVENYGSTVQKLMATNPAMCQIVSVATRCGVKGETECLVVGEEDDVNERDLLEYIWELIADCTPIVTWNGNNYDLRVIMFRSMTLGVLPTRSIDFSKHWDRRDSLDLQTVWYGNQIPPKGQGLKYVAKLHGIFPAAGDTDGGQVSQMFHEGQHDKLRMYNSSDVDLLVGLHQKWSGYFC